MENTRETCQEERDGKIIQLVIYPVTRVDIEEQIVISANSIYYNGKWLFITADITDPTNPLKKHYLWRPVADTPFNRKHLVLKYDGNDIVKDCDNYENYSGKKFCRLEAPFRHAIIEES